MVSEPPVRMHTAYLTLVIVCILSVSRPLASEGKSTKTEASFDLKSYLSVGTIHDSNVSIKEIDSQLKESDTASLLGIGLSARTKLGKLEIGTSYSFNRSKYRSFSKFNRESNILGLEVSGTFFGVRQGLSFHKADATLVLPADFTKVIWASLIGYFFFGQVPEIWVGVGAIVIFSAVFYNSYSDSRPLTIGGSTP